MDMQRGSEHIVTQRRNKSLGCECGLHGQRLLPVFNGILRRLPIKYIALALQVSIQIISQQLDDDMACATKFGAVEHGANLRLRKICHQSNSSDLVLNQPVILMRSCLAGSTS